MHIQPLPIAALLADVGAPATHRPAMRFSAPPLANETPQRRARLHELELHIHCSLIGTCLSTQELRKLVPRYTDVDRDCASDLEIHHEAVKLACGGPGARALHKALDARYDGVIRRFQQAKSTEEVRQCWDDYLRRGEVPGAYWALMTHPKTTGELREHAFGEVHMLSHLVGAANRADIRRLVALEQENQELAGKVERQQQRLQEAALRMLALERKQAEAPPKPASSDGTDTLRGLQARITALSTELAARDQAVAHQTGRRELAERRLVEQEQQCTSLQQRLERALRLSASLSLEVQAMEGALAAQLHHGEDDSRLMQFLRGKRIVYVGGRPSSNRSIRSLVEAAGGELLLHDGGIEDRKGRLSAVLPGADFVAFPVDCIDHDSMLQVKRLCERQGIAFHPLRSAAAASFVALVTELTKPAADHAAPHSHFCRRNG